jgi:hypothetical protein
LGRLRLDQKQGVVKDHIAAAEGKALELSIGLAVGGAKKVPAGRTGTDSLRKNIPRLEARHVEIAQCVLEEPEHPQCFARPSSKAP